MDNVDELLYNYLLLKKQIEDLTEQQNFIKSQLKLIMEKEGKDLIENDSCKVEMITRNTETLLKEKVRLLLKEDEFKQCIRTSSSNFIMIKEKKEKIE